MIVTLWKKRLLGGATALTLGWGCHNAALAQAPAPSQTPAKPVTSQSALDRITGGDHVSPAAPAAAPPPAAPDSADALLGDRAFYIEADTIIRDDVKHTWTARGSVEARYNGRTLRADELIYDADSQVTTVRGNVQMVNADGTSEYAQTMTLDKGFHTGVATAFSAHLQQNVTVAAGEAIRRDQDAMELNKAVFTPCDICAKDGVTPKTPTWSIQASRIVQDHKRQLIYYRNAVIRVENIPIMATPVFWHADPTAKRSSGFLEPTFQFDSRLGFSYQQPYLWVISPSAELIIAPQFDTKVNPMLEGEYKERFYTGQIDAHFGYTFENEFDNNGHFYDNLTSRSYILAKGAFAPNDNWVYGFTAERVTDPLLFTRYNVNNVYEQRGLFPTDNYRLISQAYAVEQSARTYVSIAAMTFQGLLPGDQNGTIPVVAPLVEAHYEPDNPVLGGTLRLTGDTVLLNRSRQVLTDTAPGESSQRATASADWMGNISLANGMRFQPFFNARADEYNIDNQSPTQLGDHTVGRALGTIGIDASYPFFKRQGDMTIVLEPLAQLAISPNPQKYPGIPNEDSTLLNFDETNLFDYNKSPGYDYYEAGQRLNYGARATIRMDSGASATALVGQSLRAQPDPSLAGTSLDHTASDWVVAGSVLPVSQFSAFTRALINQDSGQLDRLEAGANFAIPRLFGYVRYLRDTIDTPGTPVENMQFGGQVLFTQHWGITTSANWDIASNVWVQQEAGIVYQDECIHVEVVYEHDGTYDRALRPTDRVLLHISLATLTAAGFQHSNFR